MNRSGVVVAVSRDTHKTLFDLKIELSAERGKAVTFDDVMMFLFEDHEKLKNIKEYILSSDCECVNKISDIIGD